MRGLYLYTSILHVCLLAGFIPAFMHNEKNHRSISLAYSLLLVVFRVRSEGDESHCIMYITFLLAGLLHYAVNGSWRCLNIWFNASVTGFSDAWLNIPYIRLNNESLYSFQVLPCNLFINRVLCSA